MSKFWESRERIGHRKWLPTFSFSPRNRSCSSWQSSIGRRPAKRSTSSKKPRSKPAKPSATATTTLANLEAIVRWKSERAVHYLIGNSNEKIRRALAVAASPDATTETAVKALLELHGVDIPVASAILAAIFPERYTVLDYRALEALGPRAPRRALLRGVPGLLQAPGREQHRQAAKRSARAHAAAHARPRPVGVVAQPHRMIVDPLFQPAGCVLSLPPSSPRGAPVPGEADSQP